VQTGGDGVGDFLCSLIHERFPGSKCMKSGEISQRRCSRALHARPEAYEPSVNNLLGAGVGAGVDTSGEGPGDAVAPT
jgi:hypothetical protein